MKRQSIVSGAMVLGVGMLLVKLLGLLCKIPLSRILGTAGMGYFSASYTLFTAVYGLTVTGLTGAASQCTASLMAQGRYGDCKKLLSGSIKWYSLAGLVGCLLLLGLAPVFCTLIHSPKSQPGLWMIAPAVLFSCLASALRGHFEGTRNMTPTSLSQVAEAGVKLICSVGLSMGVLWWGEREYARTGQILGQTAASWEEAQAILLPWASAAALLGITLSTLAGTLVLALLLKHQPPVTSFLAQQAPPTLSSRQQIRRLWKLALPITFSSVITSVTSLIDLFTIPSGVRRAAAAAPQLYLSLTQTLEPGQQLSELLYGAYTMALAVFHLVPSFTGLLGKTALPALTESRMGQNPNSVGRQLKLVVGFSALLCLPAGLAMGFASPLMTHILYGVQDGWQVIAQTMALLAPGAVCCGLAVPLYSVLQGLGRADLPVWFLLVGSGVKLAGNLVLIPLPQLGLAGAAIATDVCYALVLGCCFWAVWREKRKLETKKSPTR